MIGLSATFYYYCKTINCFDNTRHFLQWAHHNRATRHDRETL